MIDHLTTVLVTTSPSFRHPSTELIENTIASVRWHFPSAEILILCDGVRPEQKDKEAAYSEFVIRLETLCLEKYANVRLMVFPLWLHQARCIETGLESVKTPLIFFTEDDQIPLPIPLPLHDMALMIMEKRLNLVRLMLERDLPPEWKHLMLGRFELNGVPTLLEKTVQWSQRSHLASVEYYRKMIATHVKPGDRCYLEERLYGQCDDWGEHKLAIFTPSPPMTRIWHSDRRGSEQKFDSVLEGKE